MSFQLVISISCVLVCLAMGQFSTTGTGNNGVECFDNGEGVIRKKVCDKYHRCRNMSEPGKRTNYSCHHMEYCHLDEREVAKCIELKNGRMECCCKQRLCNKGGGAGTVPQPPPAPGPGAEGTHHPYHADEMCMISCIVVGLMMIVVLIIASCCIRRRDQAIRELQANDQYQPGPGDNDGQMTGSAPTGDSPAIHQSPAGQKTAPQKAQDPYTVA